MFGDCPNLKSIVVSPENVNFAVKENALFEKKTQTLLKYPPGLTESEDVIPEGTIKIEASAFSGCECLTSVEIPNSVTEIGEFSFYRCIKLTDVTIPESVTRIGDLAFASCTSLPCIEIPNSVAEFGEDAFRGCDSLTLIVEKDSIAAQYAAENEYPHSFTDGTEAIEQEELL